MHEAKWWQPAEMHKPRRFSTLVMSLMLYLLAGHVVAVDSPYFAYVSGNSNNIECYRFTPTATTKATMLVSTSTTNVGSSSGYMAWSPDRAHMYTLRTGNLIAAYNINSSTGALTHIGTDRSSGGTGVTHLCVHPSGDWVYAANYSSGHVGAIPVNADGTLGVPLTPVLAGVKVHMVLTNRAGTRLYVPCLGSDHVAIYQIDQTTGALTANTPATVALPAGVGPRHMDFNSDTQGFTASAKDQFGTALVTPPTFVWTTTGGGTITSAGLFSATTVGGPFTVTATVGTKNGTASVTVAAGGGGGGGSGGGGGGGGCGLGGGLATGLLAMMFLLRPVFLRRPGSRSSRRMKTVG